VLVERTRAVGEGDTLQGRLLADSRRLPGSAAAGDEDLLAPDGSAWQQVVRMDVFGRRWTLVFTPGPGAALGGGTALAAAIALLGVLISLGLAALTASEVRAREQAERSDALRARFFAAMSHELRTPINAILGYNDLLLAGIYGPVAPAQVAGIERAQRAARHLLELVNDVLDLSKLEAGKVDVHPEPVPLDTLLDDLLATIRPMAAERGCTLALEGSACGLTVETDPRRLRQILLNLLSNATKFGAGHPVILRCHAVQPGTPPPGRPVDGRRWRAGDGVVIEVADAGPGIAAHDQDRIFEEFVQLPGSSSGGTGLGLPISRRLAEALGGSLWVRSHPGHGATFSVALPLRPPRLSGRQVAVPSRG
jgi:signal transduction histidine kinase